jgi:hypothetical protein
LEASSDDIGGTEASEDRDIGIDSPASETSKIAKNSLHQYLKIKLPLRLDSSRLKQEVFQIVTRPSPFPLFPQVAMYFPEGCKSSE